MANIGTFKKSGSELQGEIVTLSVQTKGVRIAPETNRANDNAPPIGSTSAAPKSGPPGRSARTKAGTTSRSSWTTRASTLPSTPTSSRTRTARATPSSGPALASPTATDRTPRRPARFPGRGFVVQGRAAPRIWRTPRRAHSVPRRAVAPTGAPLWAAIRPPAGRSPALPARARRGLLAACFHRLVENTRAAHRRTRRSG